MGWAVICCSSEWQTPNSGSQSVGQESLIQDKTLQVCGVYLSKLHNLHGKGMKSLQGLPGVTSISTFFNPFRKASWSDLTL